MANSFIPKVKSVAKSIGIAILKFLHLVMMVWSISMIIMGVIHRNDCPYHSSFFSLNLPTLQIMFGVLLLYLYALYLIVCFAHASENNKSKSQSKSQLIKCISTIGNQDNDTKFTLNDYVVAICFFVLTWFVVVFGVNALKEGSRMVLPKDDTAVRLIMGFSNPNSIQCCNEGYVLGENFGIEGNIFDLERAEPPVKLSFTDRNSTGYCDETFFRFSFWTFATFRTLVSPIFLMIFFIVFCLCMCCHTYDEDEDKDEDDIIDSEDYDSDELKSSVKYQKLEM